MTVLIWTPICKLKCQNANRKWDWWTLSRRLRGQDRWFLTLAPNCRQRETGLRSARVRGARGGERRGGGLRVRHVVSGHHDLPPALGCVSVQGTGMIKCATKCDHCTVLYNDMLAQSQSVTFYHDSWPYPGGAITQNNYSMLVVLPPSWFCFARPTGPTQPWNLPILVCGAGDVQQKWWKREE